MTLRPATPEELADALRAAEGSRSRVEHVDLSALTRVLEHTPEDMTVTVQAGATLASLQQRLASRGQWLPIDPPHPDRLTIAALLDANVSGPRRHGCGTIRDHLIGLRVALAGGRLIRSGGKVVKNVAGYDLMKLFIGARGTLGVIVEATFKLLPLPEAESFVASRCESPAAAETLVSAVLDSELTPTVFDLHNVPGAVEQPTTPPLPPFGHPLPRSERGRRTGGEGAAAGGEAAGWNRASFVVLGFAGARLAVDWQLALAHKLGFKEPATLDYEARFHAPDQPEARRLSVLPSRLAEALLALGSNPFIARAGNGVIFHRDTLATPKPDLPRTLLGRVKQAFDPHRIFPELDL